MGFFKSFGIDPPKTPVFIRDWMAYRLSGVGLDRYMLKAGGSDVRLLERNGAPVNGVSGTGAGFADKGSLLVDRSAGTFFQNTNTKASPTWTQFDSATSALLLAGGTMAGAIAMGTNKITGLGNGSAAQDAAAFGQVPLAATATPIGDGVAAVGTGVKWAKEDHVHPNLAAYVATQVDVATNATPAAVTGLALAGLVAAGVYRFKAVVHTTVGAAGGVSLQLGAAASLSATSLIAQVEILDNAGSLDPVVGRLTALGAGAVVKKGGTSYIATIEGVIVVNVGGTLTVQFSQQTSDATNSSVLVGSSFEALRIA